jgi:hypothetical protein
MKNRHVGPKKISRSVLDKDEKPKAEPVETKKDSKKIAKLSSQLALIGDVTPRQISKTMKVNFGEAADKVIDMLEANDNDGAMVLLQKRLLQSSVAMLTLAEKAMRESEGTRGTYQYATLVSQIRELITDIQASRDRSFIANQIIDQALRPAFINMAEFMINDHQKFRKEMQEDGMVTEGKHLEFNTALRTLARGLAEKMQGEYKNVSFKITEQLTS